MRVWPRLVRKQERPSRSKVLVINVQCILVKGREVVTHEQLAPCNAELQHAVAVVSPTRAGIKFPVPGGEEYAALFVRRGASVRRPNSAIVAIR
jgi:hypothetical protein